MSNITHINQPTDPKKVEEKLIKELQQVKDRAAKKPARFLAAWKQGIKLIGGNYFNLQGNIDKATDKNQLKPNYEIINQSLSAISTGQAHFLALMYSFYDKEYGQKMLEAIGRPSFRDAADLPDEYLDVVSELLLNYCGWL